MDIKDVLFLTSIIFAIMAALSMFVLLVGPSILTLMRAF